MELVIKAAKPEVTLKELDDILITEKGAENLFRDIPKTVKEGSDYEQKNHDDRGKYLEAFNTFLYSSYFRQPVSTVI